MKKTMKKNCTVWVGGEATRDLTAAEAHALFGERASQGYPTSIYIDGECAGESNGSGDLVTEDAYTALARALDQPGA